MNLRGKLASLEKAAGKVALANIKRMTTEQLEATLLQGLEQEAQRASTPEHAAVIRAVGKYVLTPQGATDKSAPRLLVAALQNNLTEKDIPNEQPTCP